MNRRNAAVNVLIFSLCMGCAFFVYRLGMVAMPLSLKRYVFERPCFANNWQWFLHSLSFNRTKIFFPCEYYLFRPGYFALHSLVDIVLGRSGDPFLTGSMSIILLGIAAYALFTFSRKFVPAALSVCLTLVFLVNYPGMKMVLIRDVSPYMLGYALLALGLLMLCVPSMRCSRRQEIISGVLLFAATLFHETISLTLLATAGTLFGIARLSRRIDAQQKSDLMRIVVLLSIPAVLFLCINAIDFFAHDIPSDWSPTVSDQAQTRFSLMSACGSVISFFEATAAAYLFPFSVQLTVPYREILRWDYTAAAPALIAAGVLMGALILFLFMRSIRDLWKGKLAYENVISMIVIYQLMIFIVSVTFVRHIWFFMKDYLAISTYYYTITTFLITIICAIGMGSVFHRVRSGGLKNVLTVCFACALLVLAGMNFSRLQAVLKITHPARIMWATDQRALHRVLSENRGYCLAGMEPSSMAMARRRFLLLYVNPGFCCAHKDTRTPAYLIAHPSGMWLGALTKGRIDAVGGYERVPLDFSQGGFSFKDGFITAPLLTGAAAEKGAVILSTRAYTNAEVSLKAQGLFSCGIVYGYADQDNYVLFRVNRNYVTIDEMNKGIYLERIAEYALPKVFSEALLEVRYYYGSLLFFVNDYLVVALSGTPPPAEGKIGLFVGQSGAHPQQFSDFVVRERGDTAGDLIFHPTVHITPF